MHSIRYIWGNSEWNEEEKEGRHWMVESIKIVERLGGLSHGDLPGESRKLLNISYFYMYKVQFFL